MPTAASASAPAPADEEGFDIPRRYFAAAAILIGVLMSALDSSIVNIALPTISADLGVSAASVIWVANGYQVASAAAMLTCASLGSRIGERRFYTAGLALFTIASLGCALAPSFLVLVAMRILQGLSYAVLISVGYGMYRVIFPARSLGTIFGVNALVFAVGTALGPALGGLIVSYASWPWLFYINLPLGIAAIAFSLMALGKDTQRERGFDVLGAATSAAAFGLFALAVNQIGRWSNRSVLLLAGAAAALAIVFVRGQTRARSPLLPLDIFTSRRYSFAVLTSVTMFVSQGIALVALPFVLQAAHGYSVLESALVFTPWPIAVALCAPIARPAGAPAERDPGLQRRRLHVLPGPGLAHAAAGTRDDHGPGVAHRAVRHGLRLLPAAEQQGNVRQRGAEPHRHGLWRAVDGPDHGPVHRRGPGRRRDRADGRHRRRRGRVVCHICVRPGLCDRGAVAGRQPGAGVSAAGWGAIGATAAPAKHPKCC